MGRARVDRERRVDEVFHYKEDLVAPNITYYGRTPFEADDGNPPADDEEIWQIKRVVIDGSNKVITYANVGKYNCRWDQRTTYFDAEPAPAAPPAAVAFYPSGLRFAGKITVVTINDTTWTALPASPLANRNAMSIQNTTNNELKLQYDNTTVGYVGIRMFPSAERMYDVTDSIPIYAKLEPGAAPQDVVVEEIS